MSVLDDFERVSRQHPCPVCGKSDWCLVSRECPGDPVKAVCQRVESGMRWGDAGYLHVLRNDTQAPVRHRTRRATISVKESTLFRVGRSP